MKILNFYQRLMKKDINDYPYAEWDKEGFVLPDELKLRDTSSLGEALSVFYKAGGYDFFEVTDPDKYSANWLDFVGDLYRDIDDGIYELGDSHFVFPLSDETRSKLIAQGVPTVFTTDF